jgi:hypothetical protein
MIGGMDVVIPIRSLQEINPLDAVVRSMRRRWPELVVESGGGTLFKGYSEIPFGKLNELFLYRDETSRKSWDRLGAAPENEGAMVHAIVECDELTLVVDEQGPDTLSLISEMRSLLDPLSSG